MACSTGTPRALPMPPVKDKLEALGQQKPTLILGNQTPTGLLEGSHRVGVLAYPDEAGGRQNDMAEISDITQIMKLGAVRMTDSEALCYGRII